MGACNSSSAALAVEGQPAAGGVDESISHRNMNGNGGQNGSSRADPESASARSLLFTASKSALSLASSSKAPQEPQPVRILVTGQPRSGCSTVVTHLRRVVYGEYTATELQHMAPPIQLYLNRLVAKVCEKAGHVGTVATVWADPTVKRLWKKYWKKELLELTSNSGRQLQQAITDPIIDAEYFLDHAERILRADYIPTAADMVKFHFPTLSAHTYELDLPNSTLECTLNDIPARFLPQQKRRKKRRSSANQQQQQKLVSADLPIFDTLIYVVDLSSYDHFPPGTNKQKANHHNNNELYQTLEFFRYYVNQPQMMESTCLILILNKKDLFAQKIKQVHISDQKCFSDYVGPKQSVNDGLLYFLHLFRNSVNDNNRLNNHIFVMVASNLQDGNKQTFQTIVELTQKQAALNGKFSELQI